MKENRSMSSKTKFLKITISNPVNTFKKELEKEKIVKEP